MLKGLGPFHLSVVVLERRHLLGRGRRVVRAGRCEKEAQFFGEQVSAMERDIPHSLCGERDAVELGVSLWWG